MSERSNRRRHELESNQKKGQSSRKDRWSIKKMPFAGKVGLAAAALLVVASPFILKGTEKKTPPPQEITSLTDILLKRKGPSLEDILDRSKRIVQLDNDITAGKVDIKEVAPFLNRVAVEQVCSVIACEDQSRLTGSIIIQSHEDFVSTYQNACAEYPDTDAYSRASGGPIYFDYDRIMKFSKPASFYTVVAGHEIAHFNAQKIAGDGKQTTKDVSGKDVPVVFQRGMRKYYKVPSLDGKECFASADGESDAEESLAWLTTLYSYVNYKIAFGLNNKYTPAMVALKKNVFDKMGDPYGLDIVSLYQQTNPDGIYGRLGIALAPNNTDQKVVEIGRQYFYKTLTDALKR